MNKPLSPKLKRFLDFIQRFTLIHDQSPSYEEIMASLGFESLGTVNWYVKTCLLYTSPSPRDVEESRMPSSA